MLTPKFSAVVVIHNEEDRLPACLSLLTFADEIVVVLDRCTDGSKAIALQYGAKIIEGIWPLEGPRRQAGLDACSHAWILEVDADEHVPPELAAEIRRVITSTHCTHFPVAIDNYIGPRLVRHGWGAYFGVSRKLVLFRKGAKIWGQGRVHPEIKLEGEKGPCLMPAIKHYVDDNISDMLKRLDRYTDARAEDLRAQGIPETFGRNVRRLFSRFFKCYIHHKGYREKEYGLLIAVCAALYPLISYLKARFEGTPHPGA